ncbi:MAG: hypothetical protein ABIR16_01970, partial [Dokdonella sp.]
MAMSRACHTDPAIHLMLSSPRYWTERRPGMRFLLSMFAGVALLIAMIDQLDPAFAWSAEKLYATSVFNLVLLNALPALALLLILVALTRRVALALWVTGLIV